MEEHMDDHIDDRAELYALGLLEPEEIDRADAHAAICDICAAKLGRASLAVANIVDASQRHTRRMPVWPLAVAAAFAVASAAMLQQNLALHGALADDGALLDTLVMSHFSHEQFSTPAGKPIDAKAIYERHGEWFEIVAAGQPSWSVTMVGKDGSRTTLPPFTKRGAAEIVFARPPHATAEIVLRDDAGNTVGTVKPELAPEKE
jgi:hypothetical protein